VTSELIGWPSNTLHRSCHRTRSPTRTRRAAQAPRARTWQPPRADQLAQRCVAPAGATGCRQAKA
jgi:hypothetical protein